MRYLCILLFSLSAAAVGAPLYFNGGDAPKIDGREDACWRNVPALALESCPPGKPVSMATTVKIMYDPRNLYFFIRCREVNLVEARQQERFAAHDAAVWNNDCVEILVDSKNNSRSYYQFVVDIHNIAADFLHYDPEWNHDALAWNGVWQHAVGTYDDGWTMEAAIPWSTFGLGIFDTGRVGLNVSRVRRIAPFERLVLASNKHKFHDLGCFAVYDGLKLEKPPLKAEIASDTLFLGDNKVALNLKNTGDKTVSGLLELSLTGMHGKKQDAGSSQIKVEPGGSAAVSLPCRVAGSGDYRLVLTLGGTILSSRHYTVRQLMEMNDSRPVVMAGKPCHFFLRIHSQEERKTEAVVSDASGREVLRSALPGNGRQGFRSLPTEKLAAGEYTLRILYGDQAASWPLLIVPAL